MNPNARQLPPKNLSMWLLKFLPLIFSYNQKKSKTTSYAKYLSQFYVKERMSQPKVHRFFHALRVFPDAPTNSPYNAHIFQNPTTLISHKEFVNPGIELSSSPNFRFL